MESQIVKNYSRFLIKARNSEDMTLLHLTLRHQRYIVEMVIC